jgi:DNA-binding NtrC family response regulator
VALRDDPTNPFGQTGEKMGRDANDDDRTQEASITEVTSQVARPPYVMVAWSPDKEAQGRSHLIATDSLKIGRGKAADVIIDDELMSRVHMTFRKHPDFSLPELVDEGAQNGTYCNGQRFQKRLVEPGDVVRAGQTIFVIQEGEGGEPSASDQLKGHSSGMQDVRDEIRKAAGDPDTMTVLVQGETGTGKELVARDLHRLSRRKGDFVAADCTAFPPDLVADMLFGHVPGAFSGAHRKRKGFFQAADGGTIFLDEIGKMPLEHQPTLLRVLQEKVIVPVGADEGQPIDVRVVAACNSDLAAKAKEGLFLGDLLERLKGWVIELPALRDRRGDVPLLLVHFLGRNDRLSYEVGTSAMEALMLYNWPGNVRELQLMAGRLKATLQPGDTISVDSLEAPLRKNLGRLRAATDDADDNAHCLTKEQIENALRTAKGVVVRAATILGVAPKTMYRRFDDFKIKPDDYRIKPHKKPPMKPRKK